MPLTHGELFAGISGFGLGFADSNIETLWAVDIDKNCKRVQKYHYPDRLWLDDVCEVGKHNLPYVDIISFGSPCQDLSIAGKQGGLKGERSGLFFEAIRIISELKPAIAIWENVPGAFSSNSGRDFLAVLTAFQECGARQFGWRVIDAQYCGGVQSRRRIILVTDFRGECVGEILFKLESSKRDITKDQRILCETVSGRSILGTLPSSYGTKQGLGQEATLGHCYIWQNGRVRKPTPLEVERSMNFPDNWTLADGISDSARYRMLGNAVNVAVTKRLGKNIVETFNEAQAISDLNEAALFGVKFKVKRD